jgi:hypothetical protein
LGQRDVDAGAETVGLAAAVVCGGAGGGFGFRAGIGRLARAAVRWAASQVDDLWAVLVESLPPLPASATAIAPPATTNATSSTILPRIELPI